MADSRDLPLLRWGEELRRTRSVRRQHGLRTAAAALAACVGTLLVGSLIWPPEPRLVWNVSASASIGLYRVQPGAALRRGDMVVARVPNEFRGLAARRSYVPANVPLLKRVAAAAGDRVCAIGETIWINGRPAARRRSTDGAGRPLPGWTGCHELRRGEYLLLMESETSFDGRYFGVIGTGDVIGRATLFWKG